MDENEMSVETAARLFVAKKIGFSELKRIVLQHEQEERHDMYCDCPKCEFERGLEYSKRTGLHHPDCQCSRCTCDEPFGRYGSSDY